VIALQEWTLSVFKTLLPELAGFAYAVSLLMPVFARGWGTREAGMAKVVVRM
jgi:hypothetical protein